MQPTLSRPDTSKNQVRVNTAGPWSGNAAHKAEKYFITSAKRDNNGKLQVQISLSKVTKFQPKSQMATGGHPGVLLWSIFVIPTCSLPGYQALCQI